MYVSKRNDLIENSPIAGPPHVAGIEPYFRQLNDCVCVCVCLCVCARARSGPYGTQVVLTVRKKGSKTQLEVPLVRGSPVYWYFYDENAKLLERMREYEDREAKLLERMREYEDREASLVREWVRTLIVRIIYTQCLLRKISSNKCTSTY